MLIVCPHCQARYDFPAEQVGTDGIRVRCSACGQVARLGADGGMATSQVQTRGLDDGGPAHAGYSLINRRGSTTHPPAAGQISKVGSLAPTPERRPGVALSQAPDAERALRMPAGTPSAPTPSPSWGPSDSLPPDPLEDFGQEQEIGADEPDLPKLALPPTAPRNPRRGSAESASMVTNMDDEPILLHATPPPNPVSLGGRDDRDVEAEPSIVIDMSSLGGEEESTPPATTTAPVPAAAPSPAAPRPQAAMDQFNLDRDDLGAGQEPIFVPRRTVGNFLAKAFLTTLVLGTAFVWIRNDFSNIFADPGKSTAVALGLAPASAPPRPAAPIMVEPPPPVGELTIEDLHLEVLAKKAGFVLQGKLTNKTAVVQTAITLRASLLKDGLPVRERTLACCDLLDTATALVIAQTPSHAHFSTRLNNLRDVRLAPNESRLFSVVFPDAQGELAGATLTPVTEVKLSEALRAP